MTKLHHRSSPPADEPELLKSLLEEFLANCRRPAVWEEGEDSIELKSGAYTLEVRSGRLWLETWTDTSAFSRRILRRIDSKPGAFRCAVQRFGRAPGRMSLLDLDRPSSQVRLVAGERQIFAEEFRLMLSRQFPGWTIQHLSSALDLHRSFSSVFPRAQLTRGPHSVAALACPTAADEPNLLTSALLWFDYLHSRQASGCDLSLALFLPEDAGCLTAQRMRWLTGAPAQARLFRFNEHGSAGEVDPADLGNLETRVANSISLPPNFPASLSSNEKLEAHLEIAVRRQLDTIDATLRLVPVHGQVLTFVAGDRDLIDLLAIGRDGRLCIIELKAEADLHLPVQALDYWMRIRYHAGRSELQHLFPGLAISPAPPRLILLAPAAAFHSTNAAVLRYFAQEVCVERIGVNSGWNTRLTVVMRLRGANAPISHETDQHGYSRLE